MTDLHVLINRLQPYYNELPVEGMKVLDEVIAALRELEVRCDNQETELVDARAALEVKREDVYACCQSTLIGFRNELTERNIKFICDQISRKVILSGEKGNQE